MGYYSMVELTGTIIKSKLDDLRNDISKANLEPDYNENDEPNYLKWHKQSIEIRYNESDDTYYPYIEVRDMKWYAFDEFIEWLSQYLESGKVIRCGEEIDDIDGYTFENGKKVYYISLTEELL